MKTDRDLKNTKQIRKQIVSIGRFKGRSVEPYVGPGPIALGYGPCCSTSKEKTTNNSFHIVPLWVLPSCPWPWAPAAQLAAQVLSDAGQSPRI